jgi:hypothetical protein
MQSIDGGHGGKSEERCPEKPWGGRREKREVVR